MMDMSYQAVMERARARYWGKPVPEGNQHGRQSRARLVYGCQCLACSTSRKRGGPTVRDDGRPLTANERNRRSWAKRAGQPVPSSVAHGGIWAIRAYKCRCEICSAAVTELGRLNKERERARLNAKARGHWAADEERGLDVIHWIPLDAEFPWVCPDCDEKLWERRAR